MKQYTTKVDEGEDGTERTRSGMHGPSNKGLIVLGVC